MKLLKPDEEIEIIPADSIKDYLCQMVACMDGGAHQCSACRVVICSKHECHGEHAPLLKTELVKIVSPVNNNNI